MPRDHRNGTVCLTAQQQLAFREASNLCNQDYHDVALLRRWTSHAFERRPQLGPNVVTYPARDCTLSSGTVLRQPTAWT